MNDPYALAVIHAMREIAAADGCGGSLIVVAMIVIAAAVTVDVAIIIVMDFPIITVVVVSFFMGWEGLLFPFSSTFEIDKAKALRIQL